MRENSPTSTDLNGKIEKLGEEIFSQIPLASQKSLWDRDWWYSKIMDWSIKNERFKTQMFRFVDVLPTLSGPEVSQHIREYFTNNQGELPSFFKLSLGLASKAPGLMSSTIRKNVTQMAQLFIAGANPKKALTQLEKIRKKKMAFTLDILGEACLSEKEAQGYLDSYLNLIHEIDEKVKHWDEDKQMDWDHLGPIPRVNVSVKITSLYSQIHTHAWEATKNKIKERLRPIFDKALETFTFINIDMEKYEVKDLTLEIFKELLMEDSYKNFPHFGIVIQAYLKDSYQDCQQLIQFAQRRSTPFTVRLVKGAYWDYETIEALQKNWPIPVYPQKLQSDANYERCTRLLLENNTHLRLALGSHNVRSICHALVLASELNISNRAYEIQMLYGMADPIKEIMVQKGYRVREYTPVGELLPGMSYLVRRLLENTSNQSFLRWKFANKSSSRELLQDPQALTVPFSSPTPPVFNAKESLNKEKTNSQSKNQILKNPPKVFKNEPLQNYSFKKPRENLQKALDHFQTQHFNHHLHSIVDNRQVEGPKTFLNKNPSNTQTIGKFSLGDLSIAERALTSAQRVFPTWKNTPVEERAQLLDRMASLLDQKRFTLMATQMYEAGKTLREADGDVCEAIDFCRYYAERMRNLGSGFSLNCVPGESGFYEYIPRGVSVVISPWNFPLAILTGMVVASLVTGNTVVMKPAEQTPLSAFFLMKVFMEAQGPPGVLNLVFGLGKEVGNYLVEHKDTSMICFTGSKQVGLSILEKAAQIQPGQEQIKKTITELGGKNAIIVDSDADLDEAVTGVIESAFGFQGQKCSACSRLFVHEKIHDLVLDRLIQATQSLHIGSALDPSSFMGPLIDDKAQEKALSYVNLGRKMGQLAYQAPSPSEGYFVGPCLFTGVKPGDSLAQEEIFGPLLALIPFKNLDEAIQWSNEVEYALTGSIYSRSPAHIQKAKENLRVGNLYINRPSTAALVGRHPFGGFKMSGGGGKAGGPNYLLEFMNARVVTENTLRRGFSPDLVN